MVKMSLLVMVALTLLIGMGLRWREERMAAAAKPAAKGPRPGWLAAGAGYAVGRVRKGRDETAAPTTTAAGRRAP